MLPRISILKHLKQSEILCPKANRKALKRSAIRFATSVRWLVWDFSGARLIYRKFLPDPESDEKKRRPSSLLLWSIGIYTALYGLASQRYENRLDRIENRASIIISQAGSNPRALERIAAAQKLTLPAKHPEFIPRFREGLSATFSIPLSFILPPVPHDETVEELKLLVVANRDRLEGLNLSGIDLENTQFPHDEIKLTGANLSRANFRGADLTNADLTRANLSGTNFRGADLTNADLTRANLTGAVLPRDLSNVTLVAANLSSLNLKAIDLPGDLSGTDLRGAKLSGADLHSADLRGADLSGADMTDTYLTGAYLHKADLSVADLTGAILLGDQDYMARIGLPIRGKPGADLSEAKHLTQKQLDSAHGDETTKIPSHLVRPSHWTASPDQ